MLLHMGYNLPLQKPRARIWLLINQRYARGTGRRDLCVVDGCLRSGCVGDAKWPFELTTLNEGMSQIEQEKRNGRAHHAVQLVG